MFYSRLIRPVIFRLDSEKAHHSTMMFARYSGSNSLLKSLAHSLYDFQSARLGQVRSGIFFDNPIGLAAGFDKNAEAIGLYESLGLGYAEIGSITALPSSGNPSPRAFRLPKDHALINRMGLNNEGASRIAERIRGKIAGIPIGVNIAKTHDPSIFGEKAVEDYLTSYRIATTVADYITVNISCPNTSEGKTFEDPAALKNLLDAIFNERTSHDPPLFIKLSVDLNENETSDLVMVCEHYGVDGYVCGNTSNNRTNLTTPKGKLHEIGSGGLSGRPVAGAANRLIRTVRNQVPDERTIIGVGGIDSFGAALDKFHEGADLIQIYTGLIYEGPGLIKQVNRHLDHFLTQHDIKMPELRKYLQNN